MSESHPFRPASPSVSPQSANPWVDGLTIGAALRQTAQRHPDRDALVFPQFNLRQTWRSFDAEVDRVARALLGLGIAKGEHVALWATNWPQWVLLQFATARIGAVLVTVNPAYRSHELAYVLKQSDTVALFLIDKFKTSDYFAMVAEAVPELAQNRTQPPLPPLPKGGRRRSLRGRRAGGRSYQAALQSSEYPRLRHVVSLTDSPAAGMQGWGEFLKRADAVSARQLAERESQLAAGDPINIQYTSGTTGFPKGAMLTHRNILLNAYYIGDCQKITADDRIAMSVPFYHCFGCVLGTLCCGIYGSAMIVPYEYFKPDESLKVIEAERATSVYGVPTMFIAMLDHPTRPARDLTSLRTGIMAGSPCPLEVMQRVVGDLGAREVTIAYGLTEASPVITQTRIDDPLDLRVKTVGRPLPGFDVKLVDPATGATLGDNEQGELCCRGHGVMLGYYSLPEATARAIDAEGWLHTGDLASRLPNGYYRITGRIKDMVCRGGENIYPREIEEFLYTHPAVQDVAVVGVPDPKYIEELTAWIRLKPGNHVHVSEEELRAFCKSHLAHYKVPRYIRIVTEFPQTVTGKIQKFKIREAMIKELGLDDAAKREMA
ncbi:MAG: AMP-binding protein [Planctomycetaceae bacterium]|nr:AMP-binding protein [Planctomycetaceae bacterium]